MNPTSMEIQGRWTMCLAVPGKVEDLYPDQGTTMGRVNFGGVVKEVCFAYLPDIQIGDYTIVHVGFAISKLDEASAQQTLKMFADLGMLEEELDSLRASDPKMTRRAKPQV